MGSEMCIRDRTFVLIFFFKKWTNVSRLISSTRDDISTGSQFQYVPQNNSWLAHQPESSRDINSEFVGSERYLLLPDISL